MATFLNKRKQGMSPFPANLRKICGTSPAFMSETIMLFQAQIRALAPVSKTMMSSIDT